MAEWYAEKKEQFGENWPAALIDLGAVIEPKL
jgi:hypothetical protein